MKAGLSAKRWLGVTLLIALFSLSSVANLQAKEVEFVAVAAEGTCEINGLEWSLSMADAAPIPPCADLAQSEREIDQFNASGTGWTPIQFAPTTDDALNYVFERESADDAGQGVGFSTRSSGSALVIEREMIATDLVKYEIDHFVNSGAGWEPIQFAPVSNAYWDYILELESVR